MSLRFVAPLTLCAGVAFTGCAVNPREHFAEVQEVVFARTGQHVRWDMGGAEDQQTRQMIQELLHHELSIEQAVQIALLKNPDVQATYEDFGIAQADLVQAGLLKNPVISAEIRFPARPQFPVEANLEEEFLQILFLPLRKKVAEASFEQAKATVSDAVIRRAAEVRRAFYQYQGSQQLLELRRTVLEAAEANLDASRRMREAGNSRELDYANDQALAAQARLDVTEAEAAVAEDREMLNGIMGLWGAETAAWSAAPRLPETEALDLSEESLESLAMERRQDLLAIRHGALAAARTAGFANYAAILSGAAFGVHLQRDADVNTTIGPSITAPIPIFDQGQAAVARAQAQFRQAQDRYVALSVQIRSQVRKACNHLNVARTRAAYYRGTVIPLRHRIVDQTQLLYNGMFIGVSGLLQAKQEEINASAKYVEALREYWIARSELEQAIGGMLPETPAPAGVPQEAMPATQPATAPGLPNMESMNHDFK